jgi:hypothetical protein
VVKLDTVDFYLNWGNFEFGHHFFEGFDRIPARFFDCNVNLVYFR